MQKSIRNVLLGSDIMGPDGVASFNVLRKLYEFELQSPTRVCPRLAAVHIYPNSFQRMRVPFALQVLSKFTAAGIRTYNHLGMFTNQNKEHAEPLLKDLVSFLTV